MYPVRRLATSLHLPSRMPGLRAGLSFYAVTAIPSFRSIARVPASCRTHAIGGTVAAKILLWKPSRFVLSSRIPRKSSCFRIGIGCRIRAFE